MNAACAGARYTAWSGALLLGLLLAAPAQADIVMLQPAAASTNMGTFDSAGLNISNLVNQSGLSQGYTSLSTDFATYTSAGPTHNAQQSEAVWISASGSPTGYIDFDLGGTYTLERLALWNRSPTFTSRLVGFTLLASADSSFSTTVNLGSFTSAPTGIAVAVNGEVFTLPSTSAAFVRLQVNSNGSSPSNSGFGEVAFGINTAAPVPEPATPALWLVGALAALGWARRHRR